MSTATAIHLASIVELAMRNNERGMLGGLTLARSLVVQLRNDLITYRRMHCTPGNPTYMVATARIETIYEILTGIDTLIDETRKSIEKVNE